MRKVKIPTLSLQRTQRQGWGTPRRFGMTSFRRARHDMECSLERSFYE
jgi:hypothetical protein